MSKMQRMEVATKHIAISERNNAILKRLGGRFGLGPGDSYNDVISAIVKVVDKEKLILQ